MNFSNYLSFIDINLYYILQKSTIVIPKFSFY